MQVLRHAIHSNQLKKESNACSTHHKEPIDISDSIYQGSDIDQRYSCVSNPDDFFRVSQSGEISNPTTRMRNDLFTAEAKKLFVDVARTRNRELPQRGFQRYNHLVTVSCTGFFNPGPDYAIIEGLNLNKNVQRYNIGFMGCPRDVPGAATG